MLRFRQVHLDFHTSEKIDHIGAEFSKEQFQAALKLGHVDSITVFSKCHHGWAYHPSKANETHPHLKFDLLSEQIAAAHEIDVKTPVYLSAGLDEKIARRHPEWLMRNKDESLIWTTSFSEPGYHKLCFNSPYLDYLLAQIKEVCQNYDADGIFLDIVFSQPCYCRNCIRTLTEKGLNPYDEKNILDLAESVYANYTKRVRETIDSVKPGLAVFHNGSHIKRGRRDLANMNTHLELESLPTGGWGYDHFPMSAAYVRTLGLAYLGMTGKFHMSWGEFGGFKHPNALKYEVALSTANGAKCSIGDQLHPSGAMDMATYDLIGQAYKTVEERETWLCNTENIADIGVISNEAAANIFESAIDNSKSDIGCSRILLEGNYLFNFIDFYEDFSKYKLLILPDHIVLNEETAGKINEYTKNGGKILVSGSSGLNFENTKFMIDFGCEYLGKHAYAPSYIRPAFEIKSLKNAAYVIYSDSTNVKLTGGSEIAMSEKPYFNRSVAHFCSHRHTPSSREKMGTAMVQTENAVYITYNIFSEYASFGSIPVKEIVKHAIDLCLNPTLKTNLPAQGVVTLLKQGNRQILHLMYASPVKRGEGIEIIEDILPVYETEILLMHNEEPKKVYLVPEMQEIDYKYSEGLLKFTVDKIDCWQMVVIE